VPLPIIGALIGGAAKKLAGKALRWATKGKLLGAGGGANAIKRVGGTAIATVGTAVLGPRVLSSGSRAVSRAASAAWGGDDDKGGRSYRRMNPMNVRALRRAVRRLGSAEKLFKQVYSFNHGKAAVNVRPKRKGR
jgi:hypothetical protein